MGTVSIQVTVDIYGHLVRSKSELGSTAWMAIQERNKQQRSSKSRTGHSPQVTDKIGGGGRTRTDDLGIMRPSL